MTPHALVTRLEWSLMATRSMCCRGSYGSYTISKSIMADIASRSLSWLNTVDRGVVSGGRLQPRYLVRFSISLTFHLIGSELEDSCNSLRKRRYGFTIHLTSKVFHDGGDLESVLV